MQVICDTAVENKICLSYQLLIFFVYHEELFGSPEYTHDIFSVIIVKNRLGSTTTKPQHLQEINISMQSVRDSLLSGYNAQ